MRKQPTEGWPEQGVGGDPMWRVVPTDATQPPGYGQPDGDSQTPVIYGQQAQSGAAQSYPPPPAQPAVGRAAPPAQAYARPEPVAAPPAQAYARPEPVAAPPARAYARPEPVAAPPVIPQQRFPEPDPHEAHDEDRPHPTHGHAHSHDTRGIAVSTHTRRIVNWILVPCALLTLAGLALLWPGSIHVAGQQQVSSGYQRAYGQVLQITEQACPDTTVNTGGAHPCGTAVVRVTSGPGAKSTVQVSLPQGPGAPHLAVGDEVVMGARPDPQNADALIFEVADLQRGQPMLIMLALAAVVIVAFGRLRGITALLGLAASFAVLLWFIIPAILGGESPLPVAIVGASAIMFAVLYLTHGFSVHTSVAVLGTLASLVVTGLLGALFTATLKLTGFGSEESVYLSMLNGNVDMRGLLLAGIIIGALGVLDDLTVTQASTVAELAPTARSRLSLYRSATRIGRAHVASAVNTIILAYAGASLPLLLLIAAGGNDVSDLLTGPTLAQEILRSVVGTIGLVAAVPITTGLAALVADVRHRPPSDMDYDDEDEYEDEDE